MYRPWADELGAAVDLWLVQLPGRENRIREPLVSDFHEAATAADEALVNVEAPYALFGHSMGALLAYEIARRRQESGGVPPVALFVSAHEAPHLPARFPPLAQSDDHEVVKELRALGGTPEELLASREALELFLPIVRADERICATFRFRPGPRLRCSISAFGGLEDYVTADHLRVWSAHTSGEFRLRLYPGGHFFIATAGREVAAAVAEDLQAAAYAEAS